MKRLALTLTLLGVIIVAASPCLGFMAWAPYGFWGGGASSSGYYPGAWWGASNWPMTASSSGYYGYTASSSSGYYSPRRSYQGRYGYWPASSCYSGFGYFY